MTLKEFAEWIHNLPDDEQELKLMIDLSVDGGFEDIEEFDTDTHIRKNDDESVVLGLC